MNLDLVAWIRGEYTVEEKVTAIAVYRTRNLIKAHSEEAQSDAMKRK